MSRSSRLLKTSLHDARSVIFTALLRPAYPDLPGTSPSPDALDLAALRPPPLRPRCPAPSLGPDEGVGPGRGHAFRPRPGPTTDPTTPSRRSAGAQRRRTPSTGSRVGSLTPQGAGAGPSIGCSGAGESRDGPPRRPRPPHSVDELEPLVPARDPLAPALEPVRASAPILNALGTAPLPSVLDLSPSDLGHVGPAPPSGLGQEVVVSLR